MDWLRLGLVVLVAAPVAWIAGPVLAGTEQDVWALAAMALGLGLAAWAAPADRRLLAGLGFALAALALAWFYEFKFLDELSERAGGVVVLGLLVSTAGGWADAPRGVAAGLFVVAIGGGLWMYGDGSAWEWQVGNALCVAGGFVSAAATWRKV